MARIYYDVAGFSLPRLLPALLGLTGHDHLLYGSDWPHTPEAVVSAMIGGLDTAAIFDQAQREALWHGNARRIFPRLSL
jgi:predicted TIM-barrel fold metal-dependent hydrolase